MSNLSSGPTWSFLAPGQKVALLTPGALPVFSPSSLCQSVKKSHAIIHNLEQLFLSCGLEATLYGSFTPEKSYAFYYSSSVQDRSDAFEKALNNPDIQALFLVKGGFGSLELLSLWEAQKKNPFQHASHIKPLIGYSDSTHLLYLAQQNGFATLHGPGGLTYNSPQSPPSSQENSFLEIIEILMGKKEVLHSEWHLLTPHIGLFSKPLKSTIIGGNLSVLQRHAGTPTSFQHSGKFVFLEDNEKDMKRQLDLFLHLLRSGTFGTSENPAAAILLGYFAFFDTSPEESSKRLTEVSFLFSEWLERYGFKIPLFYNPAFGHGKTNHFLPLGTSATLYADGKNKAFLEVCVH